MICDWSILLAPLAMRANRVGAYSFPEDVCITSPVRPFMDLTTGNALPQAQDISDFVVY